MAIYRPLVIKPSGRIGVLETQDVIIGNSFSLNKIITTQAVYIPDGQQHIVFQLLTMIGNASLNLQGDAEQVIIQS